MPDGSRWAAASPWAASLPARGIDLGQPLPHRTGVVVVGAGVAGLVTATVLHRAGMEVLVLERHGIGGVTTRGSTGKLTALQGDVLAQIAKHRDLDAAASYATASTNAVAGLRTLIEELGIDCQLTDADDHTYATEAPGTDWCIETFNVAQEVGLPVAWVEATELAFAVTGAIRLSGQAHLDPGALCAGLAASLPPGTVREHRAVRSIREAGEGVVVDMADGSSVTAEHVVIATLGPIHDPALLSTRCEARRSYAITAPADGGPRGMHISIDEVARSIRPATIAGRSAVVVGGGGHVVGEPGDRSSEDRWADLEAFAVNAFSAGPVAHRWVAHDLVTSDHVPFIGRVAPGAERRWVVSGFQKWGISTAFVAADLLLGELEGTPRPWSDVFDPRRLAPSLTTKLLQDGLRAARHLVVDRIVDLRPGRDDRPRCTHLGCVLDFDPAEQTWDCPCHGSRYERGGDVICGPATSSLASPPSP